MLVLVAREVYVHVLLVPLTYWSVWQLPGSVFYWHLVVDALLCFPGLESCPEFFDRWAIPWTILNPWREKSGFVPNFFTLRQVTLSSGLCLLLTASIGPALLGALTMTLACCFRCSGQQIVRLWMFQLPVLVILSVRFLTVIDQYHELVALHSFVCSVLQEERVSVAVLFRGVSLEA